MPMPENLSDFIRDKKKAIAPGKAFFWDMPVGSDGKTAGASCHWHAGADIRTSDTLGVSAGRVLVTGSRVLKSSAPAPGSRFSLTASDCPFHRVSNPLLPAVGSGADPAANADAAKNPVVFDTNIIAGSQGVITQKFDDPGLPGPQDKSIAVIDSLFNVDDVNVRQVTCRNTPSAINAVFFDRLFWDGRANRYFNGVSPFGELDTEARVFKAAANGVLESVRIQIDNAALASQAVGPANNNVEMSWNNRTFHDLGRKMLALSPLALQNVAVDDSVQGPYSRGAAGKGLKAGTDYAGLIPEAFQPVWWSGTGKTPSGVTHMEANFSLYWGLAVMVYESTLVSDKSPYDAWAKGDTRALSEKARAGLSIFMNEGRCINCHSAPEFTGATVSAIRGVAG